MVANWSCDGFLTSCNLTRPWNFREVKDEKIGDTSSFPNCTTCCNLPSKSGGLLRPGEGSGLADGLVGWRTVQNQRMTVDVLTFQTVRRMPVGWDTIAKIILNSLHSLDRIDARQQDPNAQVCH